MAAPLRWPRSTGIAEGLEVRARTRAFAARRRRGRRRRRGHGRAGCRMSRCRSAFPGATRRTTAAAFNTEAYDRIEDNAFLAAATNPLSTFSVDVDTASYANVRRFLKDGQLPPEGRGAHRGARQLLPLRLSRTRRATRRSRHDRGRGLSLEAGPPAGAASACRAGRSPTETCLPGNLVFLIDVSGSMDEPRKLPLLKAALGLLVDQLRPRGPRGDRGLRGRRPASSCRPRPAEDRKGGDPRGARAAAGGRLHGGRRGHPARVQGGGRRASSRAA